MTATSTPARGTVGAHLYRLFPKLGVTSRAGLHDALGALDTAQHTIESSD